MSQNLQRYEVVLVVAKVVSVVLVVGCCYIWGYPNRLPHKPFFVM